VGKTTVGLYRLPVKIWYEYIEKASGMKVVKVRTFLGTSVLRDEIIVHVEAPTTIIRPGMELLFRLFIRVRRARNAKKIFDEKYPIRRSL